MRIGIHYHGLLYDFQDHKHSWIDTPDGHRYGRPILIKELLKRGHDVFILSRGREEIAFRLSCDDGGLGVSYSNKCFYDNHEDPELDVVFLEYRWPTWKNDRTHPQHDPSRYEPDLDRQRDVIETYRGNTPIIAWDTDLKVTPEFEELHPELILADPSLETNRLTRDRVSLPFWTDWEQLLPVAEPYPVYGYVGNRYEREEQFQKYYFYSQNMLRAAGIQTTMHGNWLQTSPERGSPQDLIRENTNVAFGHRMNFFDSMCLMNRFVCTTHVSKQSYYETGFVSPRYLEALAVGCPALVPEEMTSGPAGDLLGRKSVVGNHVGVWSLVGSIASMTLGQRIELIEEQRSTLKERGLFSVSHVADFIESVAR